MGEAVQQRFPKGAYRDIAGICKVASIAEIEAQGWSLNPGRYVGVGERAADEFDFFERLGVLSEELELLNSDAACLQERIAVGISGMLREPA